MEQLNWTEAELENFVPGKDVMDSVPRAVAIKYACVPLALDANGITLAMKDPKDLEALDYVQMLTGRSPSPVKVDENVMLELLDRVYGQTGSVGAEESIEALGRKAAQSASLEVDGAVEMPVVRLFDRLLEDAIRAGATDLHIQPQEKELLVSFRIDGMLRKQYELPIEAAVPLTTRVKVVAHMDISERRLPQDGKISLFVGGKVVDLRVSTMLTLYGENTVLRILQQGSIRLGLSDLGFPDTDVERLQDLARRPHGIILVTGPTGSGKTTTLYAALQQVDTETLNVMTLEDPVEYRLANIRQSQIQERAGFTFARGLRALMRQDPDVILVGEMRDEETTEIAVRAALTGHLVLSTLHTNSAIGTISRLRNIGIEAFLLSATLAGIVSQRLARKICANCRVERDATAGEKKTLGMPVDEPLQLYKGIGCTECAGFGMRGRQVVYEMLIMDDDISELIAQGAPESEILEAARAGGFQTIREYARELVLNGTISVDAMTRVVA